jgi:hypothetical protein
MRSAPIFSSQADERLGCFSAALAATLRPQALRAEQAQWLAKRDKLGDAEALRPAYEGRIDELAAAADKWRAARRDVTLEQGQKTCQVPPDAPFDAPCSVDEFGTVGGGDNLRYQLQSYTDKGLRLAGGVAVFTLSGDHLTPIAIVAWDTAHYGRPALVTSAAGRLLVLRGHMEGTGNFSADALYLYDKGQVNEIDIESWQSDLRRRLPNGWGAWKGIYPDYQALIASTPLWQNGDSNCCRRPAAPT